MRVRITGALQGSSHSQRANVDIDQNGNTVLEKGPVSPGLWLEFVILKGGASLHASPDWPARPLEYQILAGLRVRQDVWHGPTYIATTPALGSVVSLHFLLVAASLLHLKTCFVAFMLSPIIWTDHVLREVWDLQSLL